MGREAIRLGGRMALRLDMSMFANHPDGNPKTILPETDFQNGISEWAYTSLGAQPLSQGRWSTARPAGAAAAAWLRLSFLWPDGASPRTVATGLKVIA